VRAIVDHFRSGCVLQKVRGGRNREGREIDFTCGKKPRHEPFVDQSEILP